MEGKGKNEYLYSAIYYASMISKRSVIYHTVLSANYLPFLRKRSPDVDNP